MKTRFALTFLLLATTAAAQPPQQSATSAVATNAEDARLNAFLDRAFEERVALSPERQTGLGRKTNYDRLDDYTDAGRERVQGLEERQLRDLRAGFDPSRLSTSGRLSYDLFVRDVERDREQFRWRTNRYRVSNNGSPMGGIPVLLINQHRVDSVADAEAYVARLRDVDRVMGEIAVTLRRQAELGVVPPTFNFEPVRADARRVLAGAPFGDGPPSAVFADFQTKVNRLQIADTEKTRLIAAARDAMTGPFRRGYEALLTAWNEIEPRAQGNRGAWSLPQGEAYYQAALRFSTTTDLTAQQIHQTGLQQLQRIHGEMRQIMAQVGFQGSLQDFFRHILTDPQFRYSQDEAGRQQFLGEARGAIARAMEAAPRYFHRLPRAPLEVRPVEAFREATAAVAFYNQPSQDGSRPGIMYVNLGGEGRLRVSVDDVSFHEGAPGHHFQIALAQEATNLPQFRKNGFFGAYIEGWALYAERLAHEAGLYRDPYQEFGRLAGEAWRAVRLVTDTGIHSMRWTPEQAMQFFRENTLLTEDNIRREVERYFNNPGQATSYMIGQLKILELRDRARQALGDRFDIRDFHAVVLESGALPLDVLEGLVDRYIAERRAR